MIIDLTKLNSLEQEIYHKIMQHAKENGTLKITEAAEVCECSTSKISKCVKKLGFENFKQFINFALGKTPAEKKYSNELMRIRNYTEEFDEKLVDYFISLIDIHEKIIILGYGPSYHCAQYFEYKLRIQCDSFIIAVQDLVTAQNLVDNNTLLVILSTTGHFTSFKEICDETKKKGGDVLLLVEEYHPHLLEYYDNICFLTNTTQSADLKPHEKSRIVFFIFIEEVIFKLLERKSML